MTSEEDKGKGVSIYVPSFILYYVHLLLHLFFARRFIVHRVLGLSYLIQFAAAFYFYFADYEFFKNSFLIWSLPLTGLLQSITAIYTFTFLPKQAKTDGGYFGDKGILSYNFIKENSFFAILLLFQWVYYHDKIYWVLRYTFVVENLIVFFPYVLRTLWPKTSFRQALENPKNKTEHNYKFFVAATWVTKVFYIWAKHYIGYFLNYARFLNRVTEEERYHIYLVLIFSAFATTISVFLHTLKFKGYMGPRLSFLVYQASYLATFYGFFQIFGIFLTNLDLTCVVFVGLLINFTSPKFQHAYQVLVMVVLNAARYNMLPAPLSQYIPVF